MGQVVETVGQALQIVLRPGHFDGQLGLGLASLLPLGVDHGEGFPGLGQSGLEVSFLLDEGSPFRLGVLAPLQGPVPGGPRPLELPAEFLLMTVQSLPLVGPGHGLGLGGPCLISRLEESGRQASGLFFQVPPLRVQGRHRPASGFHFRLGLGDAVRQGISSLFGLQGAFGSVEGQQMDGPVTVYPGALAGRMGPLGDAGLHAIVHVQRAQKGSGPRGSRPTHRDPRWQITPRVRCAVEGKEHQRPRLGLALMPLLDLDDGISIRDQQALAQRAEDAVHESGASRSDLDGVGEGSLDQRGERTEGRLPGLSPGRGRPVGPFHFGPLGLQSGEPRHRVRLSGPGPIERFSNLGQALLGCRKGGFGYVHRPFVHGAPISEEVALRLELRDGTLARGDFPLQTFLSPVQFLHLGQRPLVIAFQLCDPLQRTPASLLEAVSRLPSSGEPALHLQRNLFTLGKTGPQTLQGAAPGSRVLRQPRLLGLHLADPGAERLLLGNDLGRTPLPIGNPFGGHGDRLFHLSKFVSHLVQAARHLDPRPLGFEVTDLDLFQLRFRCPEAEPSSPRRSARPRPEPGLLRRGGRRKPADRSGPPPPRRPSDGPEAPRGVAPCPFDGPASAPSSALRR